MHDWQLYRQIEDLSDISGGWERTQFLGWHLGWQCHFIARFEVESTTQENAKLWDADAAPSNHGNSIASSPEVTEAEDAQPRITVNTLHICGSGDPEFMADAQLSLRPAQAHILHPAPEDQLFPDLPCPRRAPQSSPLPRLQFSSRLPPTSPHPPMPSIT